MDYFRPLFTLSLAGTHPAIEAVLHLLREKSDSLPFTPAISGILTREHGCLWQKGRVFSPDELLHNPPAHKRINGGVIGFLKKVPSDVFLDVDSAESDDGRETAASLLAALESGRHVVSNNKSALAFHLSALLQSAEAARRMLRYESVLLDGLPVFNLKRYCLQTEGIVRIRGILNSTSNYVLQRMVQGVAQLNALAEARAAGITEQNPDFDLNGWDAALKAAILAQSFMGTLLQVSDIRRDDWSLRAPEVIARAQRQGGRPAQVVTIEHNEGRCSASVRLQNLQPGDPFYSLEGYEYGLALGSESIGELILMGKTPGLRSRAYGFLADLLEIYLQHVRKQRPSLFDAEPFSTPEKSAGSHKQKKPATTD